MEYDFTTVVFDSLVHETDGAYLLDIAGRHVWIPQSLCRELDEDAGEVDVADWFAYDHELV